MDEIIQYFVVNKEIKMSKGKICSQVAHVATIITHEITKIMYQPIENTTYIDPKIAITINNWIKWFDNGKNQKKILLAGKEKDLLRLIDQGFYYIRDNGCNELEPETLTVCGLPPMKRSEAQKYIKRLQLL